MEVREDDPEKAELTMDCGNLITEGMLMREGFVAGSTELPSGSYLSMDIVIWDTDDVDSAPLPAIALNTLVVLVVGVCVV